MAQAQALGYAPGELAGQPLIGSLLRREEVEALSGRAPVDLRVNSLRATMEEVEAELRDAGESLAPGTIPDSNGLLLAGLRALPRQPFEAAELDGANPALRTFGVDLTVTRTDGRFTAVAA